MNWKNIAERALWTFLEGFIFAFPALDALGTDVTAWRCAIAGAGMAGISALKTLVVEIIHTWKERSADADE